MADGFIDWKQAGYTKAIQTLTNANTLNSLYPTQDIYTPDDEKDFIEGYNQGVYDFHHTGIKVCEAYVKEKDILA